MKYLAFALLSFSHGTQAESFSGNDLNNMFESGMIDKQRLLRNAIPAPRKLQNYNNGGNTQYNSYRNGNGQYSTYNGASAYNNGNNNNNYVNSQYNTNNANYQNNQANYYYQSGKNYNQNGQYYNQNVKQYNNGENAQGNVQYGYNYTTSDGNGNGNGQYAYDAAQDGNSAYNENNQIYDLPYNGNYTVRFNKCLSFAIEDDDIVQDSELIYYANSGVIVSQKSYVLFDIQECEPGSCVFDESNLTKIHIVPLEDFIDSFIEYFPTKKESYCQQCQNHYSYCSSEDGSFFDNAVFRNGGSFCYGGQQYAMINCAQCWEMGCMDGTNEEGLGAVNEWIEAMAACKATNTWWKNYPLYTGLTCNAAGDGVEFGVFLDATCKTYHRQKAFQNVVGETDWQMLFQTPSVIEYMFTSSMTCKDESGIKYMNAYQPVYGSSGESSLQNVVEQEGNTCQLGEEINQSCLNLFQDNTMGFSLGDCLNTVPSWTSSYTNENAEQSYNEDIDEAWIANDLYRYELSTSDLNDMGKVCHLISNKYAYYASGGSVGSLVSSYGRGKHTNVYNEEGSGSMFNYDSAKNNYYSQAQHDTIVNSWGVKAERMGLAEKLTFILLGVGTFVLMVAAAVRMYKHKSRQTRVEIVDKGLPLID